MEQYDITEFKPTQIIEIAVGDLSAPVASSVELSKLALIEKSILVDLLQNASRDEETGKLFLHPDTLGWAREFRMLLKDIHEITKGVQEKVQMKQLDLVAEVYKQAMKKMDNTEVIDLIKKLETKHGSRTISVPDQ